MAAIRAALPRGTPIELWWQDEAGVGQKNGITRRWAKRGTRPSAPKDQRTTSAYIYGAICPAEGKGAALVLPRCNTEGMTLHLAEISAAVAPGAHAVLILDQAGWHISAGLVIPANITLLPLPAKCPELNPVENVWQFMRDNWLSNRIFKSYDDILDHCCFAWNRLTDQPWRIMSSTCRHSRRSVRRAGPTACTWKRQRAGTWSTASRHEADGDGQRAILAVSLTARNAPSRSPSLLPPFRRSGTASGHPVRSRLLRPALRNSPRGSRSRGHRAGSAAARPCRFAPG